MRIGAHVSTAGGVHTAIGRAVEIGANCVQIFAGPPQRWAPASFPDADVEAFRRLSAEHDVRPAFIHSVYLLNPASSDPMLRARSVASLVAGLAWAERLGAVGVITHLGSSKDGDPGEAERLVCEAMAGVLEGAPERPMLLLETCAGQGNTIGRSFQQLGSIIRAVGDGHRLGVCLDTAHVYAAGHDLTTRDGLERTLEEFDSCIGLQRLVVIHVNDSKSTLGSNVDRHDNIGHGLLGEETFSMVLRHPKLRDLPFILEVPGFDKQGPDKANVDALRRLAGVAVA